MSLKLFANPTTALNINAGDTGDDVINVTSLAASYPAGVTIDGQGGIDTINLNGAISIAGTSFSAIAETITVNAALSIVGPGIVSLTGAASFASTAGFAIEIGGPNPGVGAGFHDQVAVVGTIAIDPSAALSFAAFGGYVPVAGDVYVVFDNDGVDSIGGTFSGLPEGALVSSNFLGSGRPAFIRYTGGDGNDIAIEVAALPAGESCDSDSTCASEFCTDGVCCDSRCDGALEACNLDGSQGTCQATTAAVPSLSSGGVFLAILILGAIGVVAIARSRRARD